MTTREETYVANLTKMINIPTISNGSNINQESFVNFRKLLKDIFPLTFSKFKYEEIEGSILLSYIIDNNLKPILLMSHHDVVSCEPNWSHDPFDACVKDGKLYGRGTLDTKGNLWAIFTAIEELLKEGYLFTRSIYIESSCNEESSGEGAYAISRELKKRNVYFDFTLDEGGMIVYEPIDGVDGNYAMVALAEKDYLDLKLVAKSKGGHSSTPSKDNPLVRLSKFICYIESHALFKPYLDDVTIETFKKFSLKMKGILKIVFKHAKLFRTLLAHFLTSFSPVASSIVKTTICPCRSKGSEGNNIIPEEAFITLNLRISKHDNKQHVIDKITKIAKKYNLEVEILDSGYESRVTSFKSSQYELLLTTIKESFPDVIVAPHISTGASDSKYFSDLTENNFRFAPFLVTNEQLDTMHAKDENISISSLIPAVEFYKRILKKI